jgi:hypothetical protein
MLHGNGRLHGVASVSENAAKLIAYGLEDVPAVRCNGLVQQGIVPPKRDRHRIRIRMPAHRAAFDIAKEEGD